MFKTDIEVLKTINDPSRAAGFPIFIRKRPKDLITLIITTSVIPIHPETRLIQEVLASHVRNEPELMYCRKIIMCDHPKLSISGTRHFKAGKVLKEDFDRYDEYIRRLENLAKSNVSPFINTIIYRCQKYFGFAMAVYEGLKLVETPFVMIIQHDRVLCRRFGLNELLNLMIIEKNIFKYIGFANSCSDGQVHQMISRYRMDLTKRMYMFDEEENDAKLKKLMLSNNNLVLKSRRVLVPLVFWYDSTHIACVEHYRDFVFGWHETLEGKSFRLITGDFIEDKFGQHEREDIKLNGLDAHSKYGSFLLEDGLGPFVRHCHGRMIGTSTKRSFEIYFGD